MAQKDDCICMVIGWPDTWSKGDFDFMKWCHDVGIVKDQYFRVGHAAMCLIHKETREIEYFDFGRYTCEKGFGRTRGKNTDPSLAIDLKAEIDKAGKVINVQEIVDFLFKNVHYTHGEGVIYFSFYDKMNYAKTMAFVDDIQQKGSEKYTTFLPNSTNCARFVLDALRVGTSSSWDRFKLLFTPTYKASPIGTAIDVGYQTNIYRQENINTLLENFKMTRWDNIKFIWNSTKGNFTGEKVTRPNLIEAQEQPKNVPEKAQWLGGLGEGNWINIKEENIDGVSCIRVISYYYDGIVNYDTIVAVKDGHDFDVNTSFEVTYDCSRLFITVIQNGRKVRLYLVDDYVSFQKKNINKTVSTWT
jgi:hypothetical protein